MTRTILDHGPHPVDRHVGRRVVEKRMALGHTQTDLARALGLTFQQVQKYEKGANRISASKLWDIATFFKTDIGYFFVGLPDDGLVKEDGAPVDDEIAQTRTSLEIGKLARRLSTSQQRLALNLMTEMAEPGVDR